MRFIWHSTTPVAWHPEMSIAIRSHRTVHHSVERLSSSPMLELVVPSSADSFVRLLTIDTITIGRLPIGVVRSLGSTLTNESREGRVKVVPKLNFNLTVECNCEVPVCAHAGRGIAGLLEAAYLKGRQEGLREAVIGVEKLAAQAGGKSRVRSRSATQNRRNIRGRVQ